MKLSASIALLAIRAANAQPAPQEIPAPLRPFYVRAAAECASVDRGRISIDRSVWTVRRIDLNGDGKPDYVLNRAALVCNTALTLFCGTGGCGYGFAISKPGGYSRQELQGRRIAFVPARPPIINFVVHGDECGRAGAYDCNWKWRWDGKRLAPYSKPV